MAVDTKQIEEIIMDVLKKQTDNIKTNEKADIPIGISNRHIHLSRSDLDICFGESYELTPIKDLTQPGQYACKETMTICGPKGAIEEVRVLGPVREKTQVEILAKDNFTLGINAPLRISGDISSSEGLTLIGPKGSVQLKEGTIIAKRHIHMTKDDAKKHGVDDGQIVSIQIAGERGGIYDNVIIRSNDNSATECHLDMEEANAFGITSDSKLRIIKK